MDLFVAITCNQSLSCCFFKYFFVKYFRYRFEKGSTAVTWIFVLSLVMVTWSPRLPALPLTLILSCRNFSYTTVRKHASLYPHKGSRVHNAVLHWVSAVDDELEGVLLHISGRLWLESVSSSNMYNSPSS